MKPFIVLVITAILALAVSGEYVEDSTPLSDTRPQSCQRIIDTSVFYGTCCSLNSTQGDGCVVNIKNGWCRVSFLSFFCFWRLYALLWVDSRSELFFVAYLLVPFYRLLDNIGATHGTPQIIDFNAILRNTKSNTSRQETVAPIPQHLLSLSQGESRFVLQFSHSSSKLRVATSDESDGNVSKLTNLVATVAETMIGTALTRNIQSKRSLLRLSFHAR